MAYNLMWGLTTQIVICYTVEKSSDNSKQHYYGTGMKVRSLRIVDSGLWTERIDGDWLQEGTTANFLRPALSSKDILSFIEAKYCFLNNFPKQDFSSY